MSAAPNINYRHCKKYRPSQPLPPEFSVNIRYMERNRDGYSHSLVNDAGICKNIYRRSAEKGIYNTLITILLLAVVSGCGIQQFPEHLSSAILNQPDLETVREAVPAYLVMIDTFIERSPENVRLLQAGASLYSTYAGILVDQPQRSKLLAQRAKDYGAQALCAFRANSCGLAGKPFLDFISGLNRLQKDSVPVLFDYSVSWLTWIKANSDNWVAVADLPKVHSALVHVTQLDADYRQGSAYHYLGILNTLRPPSMGGRPEVGRQQFERAIALSKGRNLGAKVDFAQFYARLVYNRELHDRLLSEVLAAPTVAPGLTLLNTIAQQRARKLLAEADSYF